MACKDKGNPSKSAATTALVTVPVGRNLNPPVFTSSPFTATVPSSAAAGTSVLQITYTDADTLVSAASNILESFSISVIFD